MDALDRRTTLEETLMGMNPDAIYFDGLDDAIVGWAMQQTGTALACYSLTDIVRILTTEPEGMSEEDALDYFGFNIQGLYVGENTPIILYPLDGFTLQLRPVHMQEPDCGEELGGVSPVRPGEPLG